jgi:hypothetical protein
MKLVFYLVATFLILIWAFLFWGFDVIPIVHILPVIAIIIAVIGIIFDKKWSKKNQVKN